MAPKHCSGVLPAKEAQKDFPKRHLCTAPIRLLTLTPIISNHTRGVESGVTQRGEGRVAHSIMDVISFYRHYLAFFCPPSFLFLWFSFRFPSNWTFSDRSTADCQARNVLPHITRCKQMHSIWARFLHNLILKTQELHNTSKSTQLHTSTISTRMHKSARHIERHNGFSPIQQ